MQAKHVSIVIKQAWNGRNYGYVGDVSVEHNGFVGVDALVVFG